MPPHANVHPSFIPELPVLLDYLQRGGWVKLSEDPIRNEAKYVRTGSYARVPQDPSANDFSLVLTQALLAMALEEGWFLSFEVPEEMRRAP